MMPFANVQATAWILKAAAIGKKHALKMYDHFAINTSCFFGFFVILHFFPLEAKWLCQERQRSQILRLSGLLLDSIENSNVKKSEISHPGFLSQLSRAHMPNLTMNSQQPRGQHRLFAILDAIDFTEETLSAPNYEIFDLNQVDQVFSFWLSLISRNFLQIIFIYLFLLLGIETMPNFCFDD